jgi:DNA repair protein RadC
MSITSSAETYKLMKQILQGQKNISEQVWVIGFDRLQNIEFIEKTTCTPEEFNIFSDTFKKVYNEPSRMSFCRASSRMILVHTHKPGYTKPTKEDFRFTKRQMDECRKLAVQFIDHIIISGDKYYSMADEGTLGMSGDLYDRVNFEPNGL